MFQYVSQEISCIIEPEKGKGGLYLSGYDAAINEGQLKQNNIKAILTIAKGLYVSHPGFLIKQFPIFDIPSQLLQPIIKETNSFIDECLQNDIGVLVHCQAGVSRSASIVIAYIMKSKQMGFEDAYKYVKSRRQWVNPNKGFKEQLRQLQYKAKL